MPPLAGAGQAGPAGGGSPPENTARPTVLGTPQEGQTLTADSGNWRGTQPISISFQWLRCDRAGDRCANIEGATGRTYRLTGADVGRTIRIHVTARNSAGSAAATSANTAVVSSQRAPENTVRPVVRGAAQQGETLTADSGEWRGTSPISISFQWLRCNRAGDGCANISGATGRTYRLAAADVGRTIRIHVTARNSAGATTAVSGPTAVVGGPSAPVNTARPAILGAAQEGQTLTADSGNWRGAQPISIAFQWLRCNRDGGSCADIVGATGRTYVLSSADVNNTIRLRVTARNSVGTTSATTVQTGVVTVAPPPGPEGQIALPNRKISIPITSVALPNRLVIDQVRFSPNPVRSRRSTIVARFRVSDTRGFVVRGALVFVRSTPLLTTTPPEQPTQLDGTVVVTMRPLARFPLRRGLNVQFFVRARKPGDSVLAGVSTRRLVQVRTAG